MDDWMDDLRRADGALRPEAGALGPVREEVRRRRRRRSAVTAVAAAASVAVVVGGVAVATQRGDGVRDRVVGDPSTGATSTEPTPADQTPADPTATSPAVDPRTFECLTESKVFDPDAAPEPEPAQVQAWKRVFAEVVARDFDGFRVHRAEFFAASGVYVLVTGDLARAKRRLASLGVAGVGRWDPSGPEVGLDEHAQLEQLIQWRLDPVLREARRMTRGIPGSAGFAYWRDADAILVQWKRPVPVEVRALEDVQFKTGGRVVVEGVRYSRADVRRAQRRLETWLRKSGHRDDWSMAHACHDGSGLVVGMVPSFLATADVPALQAELAEAVGMPVMLVPEERFVPLTGRDG